MPAQHPVHNGNELSDARTFVAVDISLDGDCMRNIHPVRAETAMQNEYESTVTLEHAPKEATGARQGARVLLVDDIRDIRLLFAAFSRMARVNVSLAENGRIAYEKVMAASESGRPFDLVLMDIEMPAIDGIMATKRLRDAGYSGTIIMHTANVTIDRRELCFEAGCNDYIEKPIARSDFLALLSRHLPDVSSETERP